MTDATDTAADTAVETPSGTEADEAATNETEGLLEGAEGEQAEGETTEDQAPEQSAEEDEHEEIERDGKKYRVPKALKPELMMHADYTRKTQEVAEARRAFDTERETFGKLAREHVADLGRLTVIEEDISKYANVDWQKLQQDDPLTAQQHWMAYQQLKDHRNELAGKITETERTRSHEAERTFATRYAETNAALHRDVKGWAETAPKVAEFAQRSGVSREELAHIATSPTLSKLLHAAWLGIEITAKQQQAAAKAKQQPAAKTAPTPLKQVTKGGTGAPPKVGLSDDLSTEEWVRRRDAQLRKRA